MIFDKTMLARYFIMGTQDVADEAEFLRILNQALRSGITLFQYREKGQGALFGQKKLQLAKQVRALTAQYHVPLVIDDDMALAHAIAADGIHFGQDDGRPVDNIKQSGNLFVGVSVSNQQEYQRIAHVAGIDHIGVGPIFATTSKSDAKPPIGISGLSQLIRIAHHPIVAIGGIQRDNLSKVLSTGVDGAAVISMISQSEDIQKTLADWRNRT